MLKIDWHLNSCWKGKHSQPTLARPKLFIFHTLISKQVQCTERSLPHRVSVSAGTTGGSSWCNCSWVSTAVTCVPGQASSLGIVVINLETFPTKGNYEGWAKESKNPSSEQSSISKWKPPKPSCVILKAEVLNISNHQLNAWKHSLLSQCAVLMHLHIAHLPPPKSCCGKSNIKMSLQHPAMAKWWYLRSMFLRLKCKCECIFYTSTINIHL